MREFTIIREQDHDPDHAEDGRAVPRRLLELAEQLTGRYGSFTIGQEAQLREAVERGDAAITLVYRVPVDIKGACIALNGLLDEADEYCRQGQELLTLATPP